MPDRFTVGNRTFEVNDTLVEERCGQHDLVTVQGAGTFSPEQSMGQMASLEINEGTNSRLISGYCDSSGTATGRNNDPVQAIFMLGASSVMRSGAERQWKDCRPFEIARDVIKPYGFCLEMDAYEFTLPLFVQSAESDWQLLARLANEIGMALIGTNTVIRIVDPSMEIRRRRLRPLFTYDVSTLTSYHFGGSPTPLGYESRVIQGIDKFGVTFSVTANEGAAVTLPAPETVHSLQDAFNAVARIERRRHTLRSAECSMPYNPILRSGTTVALTNGYETNVWFIAESKHHRTIERSSTHLVLHRDEDDQRATTDVWAGDRWPFPVDQMGRWVSSIRWEREL